MLHDVFICHASEDKDDFVRPLAFALREQHVEVWYDEFSLSVGDSLRESIDRGLAHSRFGIVVLSPAFFTKKWAQRELSGLVAREVSGDSRVVLPVWHNISFGEILKHSPTLADTLGVSTERGMDHTIKQLLKRIRPDESPLLIARDFLIERGLDPPVVTDEWWLDVVQLKESIFRYPDLNQSMRWIFPLPHYEDSSRERGLNIAWTSLQLDWSDEGTEQRICQLTRPEKVFDYLRRWPGLWECVRQNPRVLALYAPQLTIKEFSTGLDDVFDALLEQNSSENFSFSYGKPETIDGSAALCGDIIAWRHPSFGNLTPTELSRSFVSAHDHSYSRRCYSFIECLTWLLHDESNWLPSKIKSTLLVGMTNDHFQWNGRDINGFDGWFAELFFEQKGKPKVTKKIVSAISEMLESAAHNLGIDDSKGQLTTRFLDYGTINKLYDAKETFESKNRH